MTEFSDYLETELLDHILRNAAYSSPGTNVWIALYTNQQGDADSGTEVSGGSYTRVQCTAWDAPSGGQTANTNAITFPEASGSWGTVNSVGIKDSSSATGTDNLLFYSSLSAAKTVDSGEIFQFNAGNLTVQLQ